MAIIPTNGLYFLICLGGYFVVPEFVLFCLLPGRRSPLRALFTPKNAGLAAVLLGAFAIWPPVFGELHTRGAMGMFNRAGHLLVPDQTARICVYFVLAWLTCVRFARIDLGFWLIFTNIAIMMYSTGWDKYLLPVLAAFWYLGPANGSCGPPLLWCDEASERRDDPLALAGPESAAP